MKRNRLLSLLTLSFVSLIILQSNQNGYSGIVAHTANSSSGGCNCHGTAVAGQNNILNVELLDASNNVVNSYIPNTNYTVRVVLKKNNANNAAGMQATIFDAGTTNAAGTISNGTLIKKENIMGTIVANHTQKDVSSLKVGSDVTWTFPWKSSLIAASDVTISVVANDCNNDNGTGGDLIVYKDLFITKTPAAVEDFSKGIKSLYPNPTANSISIELDKMTASNIKLFSVTGQLVKSIEATGGKVNIDMSDLLSGNYIITIEQGDNFARQQVIKY